MVPSMSIFQGEQLSTQGQSYLIHTLTYNSTSTSLFWSKSLAHYQFHLQIFQHDKLLKHNSIYITPKKINKIFLNIKYS